MCNFCGCYASSGVAPLQTLDDIRPKAERRGWLTQKEIDKPEIKENFKEPSEKKSWIESIPGGWSTLIVLICFIAGMWGLWLIWQLVGK